MLAYQAPSPLRSTPLRRRASGLALALGINLLLLLVLLGIGILPMELPKGGRQAPLVVNLTADSESSAPAAAKKSEQQKAAKAARAETKPLPKPRITLPAIGTAPH